VSHSLLRGSGIALLALSVTSGSAAVVSGTVSVVSGRGIRASLSIHDLSTPRTAGHKPYDHQFASKADGTFSLTGVPAGKYRICVDAPQENVLDPCLWSDTQQTWTVADSDNLTKLAIKVPTGTQLKVHVNDPQGALPQTKGGVHGEALSMVVVTNRKRYHKPAATFGGEERERSLCGRAV
jgi:hypothetical protein